MTQYEILRKLEELFIITRIGDEYFLSEAVEIPKVKPEIKKLEVKEYEEILSNKEDKTKWPFLVANSRGRTRAEALMNYAEIPATAKSGYRVRGLNKESVIAIDKLVDRNPDLRVDILFDEIKYYYATQEFPKSFKKLVIEGDLLAMYNEGVERKKIKSTRVDPNDKRNTTWG